MDFKLLFIGNLIRSNYLESDCDASGQVVTEGIVEIWQQGRLCSQKASVWTKFNDSLV
jgi:hypothetical protein